MKSQKKLENNVLDLLIRENRPIDLDEILEAMVLEKTNYHKLMIVSMLQDVSFIEKEYLIIDKKTRTFFKFKDVADKS
ncbi:MAG: hypothetical protein RR470_09805 [Vagococcus sp.]|uniref:hypothetical protein n=1 Tax=Vagococcus sp. TaxID=1933889 RepID=UPI002FCBD4A7